jgi:hypothetical protein
MVVDDLELVKRNSAIQTSDNISRREIIFLSITNISILKLNSTWIKFGDGSTTEISYATTYQWPRRKNRKRTQPWKRITTHKGSNISPTLCLKWVKPPHMNVNWSSIAMFTYNLNQTQLDKRITPPLALPSYVFPGPVAIGTPKIDIFRISKVPLHLFLVIAHACIMWTTYQAACENFWVED